MNTSTKTEGYSLGQGLRLRISDFSRLVKFRLSALAVFSAFMAYLLALPNGVEGSAVLVLVLGGFLVTAAASILNQVLEKDYDKLMKRTAERPLAAGRMEVSQAVLLAGLFSVLGLLLLSSFNALTGVLAALSLISYAFIYTPMKRVSPLAVWVGAVPGALPMAIGWVAATGSIGAPAVFLFSAQFLWQFPHFWAIAWLAHEDYVRAGFHLLPTKEIDGRNRQTALQAALYALGLVPLSWVPYFIGMSGIWAAWSLTICSVIYFAYACKLYRNCNREAALHLMFSSFFYLPVMLMALWFDRLVA